MNQGKVIITENVAWSCLISFVVEKEIYEMRIGRQGIAGKGWVIMVKKLKCCSYVVRDKAFRTHTKKFSNNVLMCCSQHKYPAMYLSP